MLSFKEVKIKELIDLKKDLLNNITEQERQLLNQRLGDANKKENSYKNISQLSGISYERVRQRLNSIYNKLDKINVLMNLESIDETLEIEYLPLSKRSYNSLKRMNLNTIGDLERIDEANSNDIKYLGKHGYEEIKRELIRIKEIKDSKKSNKTR